MYCHMLFLLVLSSGTVCLSLLPLDPAVSPVFDSTMTPEAQADLITELPGLSFKINYRQFSGYLNAGNGTFLHYWYVESEGRPRVDPLLLWLNGGPGCSSLDGFLNELGPTLIMQDGTTLLKNNFSWNTFSNVLFLESPACVGFSYNEHNDCSASDDSTAQTNHNALKHFFVKFPALLSNPMFVTGESYGGVYVPMLTLRLLDGKMELPVNLHGFAVGNGLSSTVMNDDSIIFFANYHGLLGNMLWQGLVKNCCDGDVPSQAECHFSTSVWPVCQDLVSKANAIIFSDGLNMYNLYADCIHPQDNSSSNSTVELSRYRADKLNMHRHNPLLHRRPVELDPPCTDSSAMRRYLNSHAVRAALHIPDHVPAWEICSDQVNHDFVRQYETMAPQYRKLAEAGVRGLVYNGDVDMACNFIGDQWFVESLRYKETETRRMWMSGGQVGGFVKRFELLDLVTVRGSGHMVPQDKPAPALHMIKSFVTLTTY